jgi:outer membrane lipopolysaccharide assembly protein LptE/RlpB
MFQRFLVPRTAKLLLIVISLLALNSCGYTLVREKGVFNGEVTALAVPMFKNETFEAHSPGYFTEAFSKELASSGLFYINNETTDATLIGTVKQITVSPLTFNRAGVAAEKTVYALVALTLTKQGNEVRKYAFYDAEPYETADINLEDFNRRQALQTIAERMAKKLHSQVLFDY